MCVNFLSLLMMNNKVSICGGGTVSWWVGDGREIVNARDKMAGIGMCA